MKKLLILLLLLPFIGFSQALSGNYIIGASQPAPFNTITSAVNKINSVGVSSSVIFLLEDNSYSNATGEIFPINISQFAGSSSVNTLTIKPNSGNIVTITASNINGYTAVPAVFKFNGADNITIDGSNSVQGNTRNLTIINNDNIGWTGRSVLWIASEGNNGATNIHVSNTILKHANRNGNSNLLFGIYSGSNNTADNQNLIYTTATAANSDMAAINNEFVNIRQAIYVDGSNNSAQKTNNVMIAQNVIGSNINEQKPALALCMKNVNNFTIQNNTISGLLNQATDVLQFGAVKAENCSNFSIKNNTITNLQMTTNAYIQNAILIKGVSTNGTISENKIANIKNTGGGIVQTICLELDAANASNMLVANNFLNDISSNGYTTNASHGVYIASGKNIKIYHNTIAMNSAQDNISAALYINSGSEFDIRNNIFGNSNASGSRYAVYSNVGASAFSAIDYNNYFSQNIGYLGGDKTSLAQFKNATGQDSHSVNISPVYTSTNDLHLKTDNNETLNNAGTPLSAVTTDIDGAARSNTRPDLGADEFEFSPFTSSTTWNGTEWSNGTPLASEIVIFTGNYTASDDIVAGTIKVAAPASVIIPSGVNVTLKGALTVEDGGSFTLNSNANLLQPATAINVGNISIKRQTAPLMRLDYILWSSPVSGQALLPFSPATSTNRFYNYNPTTNLFASIADPATTNFDSGVSYLIRMPNNHPATPTVWEGTFTGVPHNGTFTVPVIAGTYNAIGNPYPSTVDADKFLTSNNITQALYFWRKTNNAATTSYATYTRAGGTGTSYNSGGGIGNGDTQAITPNGVIAIGQGFIIKAPTASVTFTNDMRVANNQNQFLRAGESIERNRIWLNLTGQEVFSQTMVSYMDGATMDLDPGIDGEFMNDSPVALTSIINGAEYAIQGRSLPFNQSDAVSLGFKALTPGDYSISIDHVDGLFTNDQDIFLRDKVANVTFDLRSGAYNFTSEAGSFNTRFEIVYQNTLGTESPSIAGTNIVVYKQNGDIKINAGTNTISSVKVFDIHGRIISQKTAVNANATTINAGPVSQVLIVQITTDENIVVTKKIVN